MTGLSARPAPVASLPFSPAVGRAPLAGPRLRCFAEGIRDTRNTKDPVEMALGNSGRGDESMLVRRVAPAKKVRPLLHVTDEGPRSAFLEGEVEPWANNRPIDPFDPEIERDQLVIPNPEASPHKMDADSAKFLHQVPTGGGSVHPKKHDLASIMPSPLEVRRSDWVQRHQARSKWVDRPPLLSLNNHFVRHLGVEPVLTPVLATLVHALVHDVLILVSAGREGERPVVAVILHTIDLDMALLTMPPPNLLR